MKNYLIVLLVSMPILGLAAAAPPPPFSVTEGNATVDLGKTAFVKVTQADENVTIVWNEFNLNEGVTFNIYQPSADSVLINEVLNNPTQLSGRINTIYNGSLVNGTVIFINPNGVTVGNNATFNANVIINPSANDFDANGLSMANVLELKQGHFDQEFIIAKISSVKSVNGQAYLLGIHQDGLINFSKAKDPKLLTGQITPEIAVPMSKQMLDLTVCLPKVQDVSASVVQGQNFLEFK